MSLPAPKVLQAWQGITNPLKWAGLGRTCLHRVHTLHILHTAHFTALSTQHCAHCSLHPAHCSLHPARVVALVCRACAELGTRRTLCTVGVFRNFGETRPQSGSDGPKAPFQRPGWALNSVGNRFLFRAYPTLQCNPPYRGFRHPGCPFPSGVGHFGLGELPPKAPEEKRKVPFTAFWVSGWQGGWGPGAATPAPPVGVGHFWVPGFCKNLGLSNPPPPPRG